MAQRAHTRGAKVARRPRESRKRGATPRSSRRNGARGVLAAKSRWAPGSWARSTPERSWLLPRTDRSCLSWARDAGLGRRPCWIERASRPDRCSNGRSPQAGNRAESVPCDRGRRAPEREAEGRRGTAPVRCGRASIQPGNSWGRLARKRRQSSGWVLSARNRPEGKTTRGRVSPGSSGRPATGSGRLLGP